MFQLLDNLDLEYTCLQSLNRWETQSTKNRVILALNAELSSLKAYIAKLQETTSQDSGGSKKPTQHPKDGKKQAQTINGVTWHYCQKYFSGKGSWNKPILPKTMSKVLGKDAKIVKTQTLQPRGSPLYLAK
jgi:hypothetical protein